VEDWGTGRFVVDAQSMLYVIGTQIDWREEVFGSQFEISNPNATAGCGCGESFGV
jgi:iron-sulfur cluster assembly accessory protein